jgi:ferrous iron transport protein B
MTSPAQDSPALQVIALTGNPNCGKTTLFNSLTGLRQKVANYPGVTVEKKYGRCSIAGSSVVEILDLPGTYSLVANSPDEQITMEVVRGLRGDTAVPDVIVAVVDASNLARNLYLVSQIMELGVPFVIALNMTDIADRRGQHVDANRLSTALGVPVVPIIGHRGVGVDRLKATFALASVANQRSWSLPPAVAQHVDALAAVIPTTDEHLRRQQARRLLAGETAPDLDILRKNPAIVAALEKNAVDPSMVMQADIEARYHWIDSVVSTVVRDTGFRSGDQLSDRIDAVLVHPVLGLGIFSLIMASLFVTIFLLADPLMGMCEDAVAWLGGLVTGGMAEGTLKSLLADGVFGGVGGVVVFVPQIALLFLFLAVLEDSGYLARAAFLMDKLLSKVGLHGRSFIPLLSSFACAIPGVMATRTIENPRERLATILVAPFMSCSARLPVYGLLIGSFFGPAIFADTPYASYAWLIQGGIMLACYALGVVAAAITAYGCKIFLGRGEVTPFILEMPSYKFPQFSEVARQVWSNTAKFLTKAGSIIFCLSIVLWAMAYFPRMSPELAANITAEHTASFSPLAVDASPEQRASHDEHLRAVIDEAIAGEQLKQSISGRLGHFIEPVIAPLGYDWKIGVGLIAAFAAREVFVSNMAVVYSVSDPEADQTPLEDAIHNDTYADGKKVWTPLVATSLLVWFVLAMQCISTTAIVRRETGGWKWPLLQMIYMNVLAYTGALLTYQIGSRLFGW